MGLGRKGYRNSKGIPGNHRRAYQATFRSSHPVYLDREEITQLNRRIVMANVKSEDEEQCVRHDPYRLAKVLIRWYSGAKV